MQFTGNTEMRETLGGTVWAIAIENLVWAVLNLRYLLGIRNNLNANC